MAVLIPGRGGRRIVRRIRRSDFRRSTARFTSIPRAVMRRLDPETKYQVTQLAAAIGGTAGTGSIFNMCTPAQGSTAASGARIGDKCFVKWFEYDLRYYFNLGATVAAPLIDTNQVRMIIFKGRDPSTQTAALFEADYFDQPAAPINSPKAVTCDLRTLGDRRIGMNTHGDSLPRCYHIKGRVAVNQELTFVPTTTTLNKGVVGLYICSNVTPPVALSDKVCNVAGLIKWAFTDV